MFVAVVNMGIVLAVPPLVVTLEEARGETEEDDGAAGMFSVVVRVVSALGGAASTNAEGGSPPIVSASAAFMAYGTATSKTRACSASCTTCTASQRASPDTNKSEGNPLALVVPSCTE